ncbi:glycosyl hydrolase family 39 [Granulicella cerasi]|uniref:Glycosyl hydrolase family 39 n=1 Tax=Granulicella cerasi TaxID=741063 RepID=A0ABW1Z674_9BACT|nr:glycosyl hydrolase family 39 [Granulicella cerasi]
MHPRKLLAATLVCLTLAAPALSSAQQAENITINAKAATTPFPHFWEQTFGSGRAILALRDSYRQDLRTVKQATDFKSVRFHGILNDEVGIYDPDRKTVAFAQMKSSDVVTDGSGDYNFSYLDQIYDGLLANNVRPFVELSFMPKKLAADPNKLHPFWYKPIVSPPRDYAEWDKLITAFAQHVIARYGIDEVATWKFETWNEPNLDFWGGEPKQATYFELYDHTARALKAVSPRIQIGGPATAQAAWVGKFLQHLKDANVPADFVSTHVYANDTADNVLGTNENVPRDTMVYRAVKMVHEQILASPYPKMPLIFSEYNASYANEPNVTDSPYIGAWLANNIRLCDGLTDSMDYWSFSDVFEEQGVVRTPFYGGFGLVAADNIPKASLNAFRALHRLGVNRIAVASDSALATTANNELSIALWNYAAPIGTGATYTMPTGPAGPDKVFHLDVKNAPSKTAQLWRVDWNHGNALKEFDAMGRPQGSLTRAQIDRLQKAGAMAAPEAVKLTHDTLDVTVPAQGLAVLVFTK